MATRISIFFLSMIIFSSCEAQQKPAPPSKAATYTYSTPSRDGIGKYYLGREISHVMGHLGASWLERPEREREENVSQAIMNLSLIHI